MGVLYEAVGKINKAIKSYKKSIELGGATHHLRRLYAKMGGKEEAFKWLEESLRRGEVSMDDIMKDKDWENLRQDPAYLALVERFGGVARTD